MKIGITLQIEEELIPVLLKEYHRIERECDIPPKGFKEKFREALDIYGDKKIEILKHLRREINDISLARIKRICDSLDWKVEEEEGEN